MHQNLVTSLDRADELLRELLAEYNDCLRKKAVTDRATQLTHDVCEKLRNVLDRTARRYWDLHVAQHISEEDRKIAAVYFPIVPNQANMDSILGRWRWKSVRQQHQLVYDYLLSQQPFMNPSNCWLAVVNDLAIAGKHIDLVPQVKHEERRTTVSGPGGSVSWGSGVTFGSGVSIMGAPVDPRTQRIIPTHGLTEKIETWISFVVVGHNVNAAGLCTEACAGTRRIANEMTAMFGL